MRAATAREQRTRSIDHAAAATRSSTANDSEGEVVAAGHEKHRTTTAADKVAAADRIDTVVRATQRGRAAMQVEAARIGPGCMTVTVHKVQHTAAREARKAHARITLPRAKQHRTDQAHEDQVHEDQAHYTQALAAEARANRSRAAQARAEYRQARAREVAFAFQQPQSIPQAQAFQQAQEIRALQYIYARQQAIAAQQAHAVQRANVVQQAIYFTAAATVSEPTAVGAETMNKSHVKHFVDSYRRHLAEHMRTNRGTEPFPDVVMQQVLVDFQTAFPDARLHPTIPYAYVSYGMTLENQPPPAAALVPTTSVVPSSAAADVKSDIAPVAPASTGNEIAPPSPSYSFLALTETSRVKCEAVVDVP